MRRENEPYTEAELKLAIKLKERPGTTWRQVGIRIGRDHISLGNTVGKYRRGLMKFSNYHRDLDDDVESIVHEILRDGVSLREVARRRGRAPGSVHRSLVRRGWDSESIAELRQEIAV